MKIIKINPQTVKLICLLDELLIIHQSLNEVCNGLYIPKAEEKIGFSQLKLLILMKKLKEIATPLISQYQNMEIPVILEKEIDLSLDELKVIYNSLHIVLQEIDDFEFETRIGADSNEVLDLIQILKQGLPASQ